MAERPHTGLQAGAEDGLLMGLYFIVMIFLNVTGVELLSLVSLLMMLGVPVAAFMLLRRAWRRSRGTASFGAMWMMGICTFFFGSLLLAAVVFVMLRFVAPDFMLDRFNEAVAALQMAGDSDSAQLMQQVIDSGAIPTAIDMAFTILWLGTLSGSLLSLILAPIVRLTRIPVTPPPMD